MGCMVATRFDQLDALTLLIDIGTNGEMVLGDRNRRVACSTAAGQHLKAPKSPAACAAPPERWIM